MKTFPYLLFLLITGPYLMGQDLVRENWQYRLDDKAITKKEVKQLYKKVPNAYKQFKKAQIQLSVSSGLILLGGTYTGERIGRFTATGDITWNQAGIGLGVLALGIVSSIGVNKKYNKAVQVYNQQKSKKTTVKWTPSKQGLGIIVCF